MTPEERLARGSELWQLLSCLRAEDFGGHPLCSEVGGDLFFPEKGENHLIPAARKICDNCEIKASCMAFAVRNPAIQGIWGGTTDKERQHLRSTKRQHQSSRTTAPAAPAVELPEVA